MIEKVHAHLFQGKILLILGMEFNSIFPIRKKKLHNSIQHFFNKTFNLKQNHCQGTINVVQVCVPNTVCIFYSVPFRGCDEYSGHKFL
jgi:hypothetical protein